MKTYLILALAFLFGSSAQALSFSTFTNRSAFEAAVADHQLKTEDFSNINQEVLVGGDGENQSVLLPGQINLGMFNVTTERTGLFADFEGAAILLPVGESRLLADVIASIFSIDGTDFFFHRVGGLGDSRNLYTDFSFPNEIIGFGADFNNHPKFFEMTDILLDEGVGVIEIGGVSFNTNQLIGSDSGEGFLGVVSDTPFNQIRFVADQPGSGGGGILGTQQGIDNFSFAEAGGSSEVPEPATVLLLGLAIGGLGIKRRLAKS